MKKRSQTLVITMLFCGVLLSLGLTETVAHPAYASLSYDEVADELTVAIDHPVASPTTHYILSVAITINSVLNETYTFESQPNDTAFNLTYSYMLVDGDVVSVLATCNEGGDYTATLTIGEVPTTTDDPTDGGDGIPGYTMFAAILSLLTLGALLRVISRRRQ